ncbi:MAG: hypothetical protein NW208_12035 [Bryobacter sp.]|nr:hypothetical protein [Bryobacter sp.]
MRLIPLILLWALVLPAQTVYYTLWFDTEDYIDPKSDDAALRLAQELEKLGVKATFKVVGETAVAMEKRGRWDVIRALAKHDIGFHTANHSIPPTPAQYLSTLGMAQGAAEFVRREGPMLREVERIFGRRASCYGQPGNSWGPQSTIALRQLGVPAYVDEARQILLNHQPYWYGGVLHVYNLGPYGMRAELNEPAKLAEAKRYFDQSVDKLRAAGGGVIQTYYHPNEWVSPEFWDAVNFSRGAFTEPAKYRMAKRRSPESEKQAYEIFLDYIRHIQKNPHVKIITTAELPALYADAVPPATAEEAREAWREGIHYDEKHSAAELLVALLGMEPRYVDGPDGRTTTLARNRSWSLPLWQRTLEDVRGFIRTHGRLPAEVYVGSDRLSLADFAATLAATPAGKAPELATGRLLFEKHIATDGRKSFDWVIHPENFDGAALLEMGRWQAWTLKPARLLQ